ncbi:hypothetical protein HUJ04_011051 [Dendroctonus ponderosae]|nr:hypothetical protein HUJ04_011051 [Dendroctonus ponderosae]
MKKIILPTVLKVKVGEIREPEIPNSAVINKKVDRKPRELVECWKFGNNVRSIGVGGCGRHLLGAASNNPLDFLGLGLKKLVYWFVLKITELTEVLFGVQRRTVLMANLSALRIKRGYIKGRLTRFRTHFDNIDLPKSTARDWSILSYKLEKFEPICDEFMVFQNQIDIKSHGTEKYDLEMEERFFDEFADMRLVQGKCYSNIAEADRNHANKERGEWFQEDTGRR